jgi:hypothetical protein
MTILEWNLFNLRHLLVKAFLPVAMILALPSTIQKNQFQTISKILIIQTSKMDPPRIAFDELNQSQKIAAADWKLLELKNGISLKSGAQHLSDISIKDILRVKKITIPEMTFTESDISEYIQNQRWIEELPVAEAKRFVIANEKHGILNEKWSAPDLRQATQQSILEAAEEDPEIIKKISQPAENTLVGQVELQGGLPSGPFWQMEISRYQDNVKKEDAIIDPKKSAFKILVAEPTGRLEAKLKDTRTGEVIGEGAYRLSPEINTLGKAIKIVLTKTNNQIVSNFRNFNRDPYALTAPAHSTGRTVPTKTLMASVNQEGETDESGLYGFDQVKKGSRGILRAQAEGFYPALYSVRSGEEKTQSLFSNKMITAMRDIVREQNISSQYAETGSIVWGQVKKSGKALSGAEIEVENFPNYKVVYLNSLLIPDLKLKATSENGYFIVLDLPPGFHSFLAKTGNLYLSHINAVVDDQTISTAEIEVNDIKNTADVKVFNAFSGNPESASVEFQSLPEALNIDGYAAVLLPEINRLSFLNITPLNPRFLKTMMNYEDTDDFIHIPLIESDWVHGIMNRQKINLYPDRGLIIGFVDNSNYEIYLGYDNQFSRENIVYFDPHGNISEKAVLGGGFIIFNVPLGPQSVVLAEADSGMLQMQMVDVNVEATSVIKF